MGKPDQESAAAEEARRATGAATGRGRGGRFSAGREARDGAASAARGGSRVGVAGIGDHGGAGLALRDQFLAAGPAGGAESRARMPGTTTTVGCKPRSVNY